MVGRRRACSPRVGGLLARRSNGGGRRRHCGGRGVDDRFELGGARHGHRPPLGRDHAAREVRRRRQRHRVDDPQCPASRCQRSVPHVVVAPPSGVAPSVATRTGSLPCGRLPSSTSSTFLSPSSSPRSSSTGWRRQRRTLSRGGPRRATGSASATSASIWPSWRPPSSSGNLEVVDDLSALFGRAYQRGCRASNDWPISMALVHGRSGDRARRRPPPTCGSNGPRSRPRLPVRCWSGDWSTSIVRGRPSAAVAAVRPTSIGSGGTGDPRWARRTAARPASA